MGIQNSPQKPMMGSVFWNWMQ